jgi:hypothetical protein
MFAAWLSQPAWGMTCSSPTLKGASGVIGNKHGYKITGECTYTWSETETSVGSSTTTTGSLSFSYLGSASWDRLTGEAVEKLKFTGDATGERAATANCSQDPFLKDPPGGAAKCGPVTVQVEVKSGGIYKLLLKEVFWASKKLSLAEAQALSSLPPPSQPPPEKPKTKPLSGSSTPADATVGGVASPGTAGGGGTVSAGQPPQDVAGRAAVIEQMQRGATAGGRTSADARRVSPPAGGDQRVGSVVVPGARATQMEFEGEALVKSGAFQINGGQARVQQMVGFGSGWSGGEQLFWSEGAPGAVLDLVVNVPAASKYAVEIYMTRAPDFGQIKFEIDGQASIVPFDGMAPQVMPSGPVQLGSFPLQAGSRRVSLMIIGKYAQSAGYFVGIDKLRLYPAGPID